jgi:peptide/nickel transport system permease protein
MTDERPRHGLPRDDLPDPESGAPVQVPESRVVPEPEEALEIAAERPADEARVLPGSTLAAGAVLPGAGHMLAGRAGAGIVWAGAWLALLAIVVAAHRRILAAPRTGSLDDWVAIATLALGLALVWWLARRDLRYGGDTRPAAGDSQWRIAMRHFRRNRLAVLGLWTVLALYAVALLAPLLAPYDPIAQVDIARTTYLSPSIEHPLGTDRFGRDILSRIIYGARVSLSIGFIATAISVTLGTLLGAFAGYLGGKADTAVMRFTDLVLAFPRLVLLILIVALFEPSMLVIILVLGLTQWPGTTRIVRGDVLSLREREFIQAANALGMSRRRVILRHLIPNVLAPVIVTATLGIGNTIVLEAGLAFLGLGVPPPTPTWGDMVAAGRDVLTNAWWVATFPGLTIVLVVLAFNLVGDGLRDALDPRLR